MHQDNDQIKSQFLFRHFTNQFDNSVNRSPYLQTATQSQLDQATKNALESFAVYLEKRLQKQSEDSDGSPVSLPLSSSASLKSSPKTGSPLSETLCLGTLQKTSLIDSGLHSHSTDHSFEEAQRLQSSLQYMQTPQMPVVPQGFSPFMPQVPLLTTFQQPVFQG